MLGYRALLTDATSGEFAVIRTYPVSTVGYVLGCYWRVSRRSSRSWAFPSRWSGYTSG
ncbi:copper ABC transporter permease [Halorubrum sp. AJ67]|nr:copper ABC transporter permease [Halorubrum sp. AJ67]